MGESLSYVLDLKNVSKSYGGVKALKNVNFDLIKGEIHCLVGENGSGKSTLIKIISGAEIPDQGGKLSIKGNEFKSLTPIKSVEMGIQVIYQDLSLFPNLSVYENIAMSEYNIHRFSPVNRKKMQQMALDAMKTINVSLNPNKLVRELSIADKQIVAITRAIAADAELIIMDEPTASLSKYEIDELLKLIKRLQRKGLTIVFVSHKLDEIMSISQRVTVLRDGDLIGTHDASELDERKIEKLMTGMEFENKAAVKKDISGKVVLEAKNLSRKNNYKDVSLKVHEGEILGITGLMGSGRTELALSIFGMNQPHSGKLLMYDKPVSFKNNYQAIQAGIAYVPEDRLTEGLILPQSIGTNMIVPIMDRLVNRIKALKQHEKNALVKKWVKDIGVKTKDPENAVQTLSGGNQQKVVLAKWLITNPRVLILDNPTVGVDIAAKNSIYKIMKDLATKGLAIILITDEVPEVYRNSDRILIMSKGRVVEETSPYQISEKELNEKVIGGVLSV
ncbi:MAG: sugar ABC transporter ATP-binding protein [Spartobacteria bacterium]|nr:sugar ABC transporter ATP-binding protein [Spartobacteria bacterium]